MKSFEKLLQLWFITAGDLAVECCTSADRDFKTVTGRSSSEGLSFLTITLPKLCTALEYGLRTGTYDSSQCTAFAASRKGSLPVFLGGFFCQVFDPSTGVLLDVPSVPAIRAIRQLTLMFKKLKEECSPARARKAFLRYVECDVEVRQWEDGVSPDMVREFGASARLLWGGVFNEVNDRLDRDFLRPKHGPGATATRIAGNQKYEMMTWTERLESVFPYIDYALPSYRYHNRLREIDFLTPASEPPSRVVHVAKTLDKPRIIAIEPVWIMYCQQALADGFLQALKHSGFLSEVALFNDQIPNQEAAREGSLKGSLATLDLKEASDRVSNLLVKSAVRSWPTLSRALQASRSERADVPGNGVINLAKFASMGSAMCFVMEEVVFSTIVFMAIARAKHIGVLAALRRYSKTVRVYGDDIIVPVDCVTEVIDMLEAYGLVVNRNKSFWTGRFRESCGKEYYAGEDVTVFRVSQELPTSRRQAKLVESAVSLRNHAYKRGFWSTASFLDDLLVDVLRHYPLIKETSNLLGRCTFLEPEGQRVSKKTQTPISLGWVSRSPIPKSSLEDEWALVKFFISKSSDPARGTVLDEWETDWADEVEFDAWIDPVQLDLLDAKSLELAGRPKTTQLSLRWRPIS